jgi:TolA-binding protein
MTMHNPDSNGNSDMAPGSEGRKDINDDLLLNLKDSDHFETFGEYIKGRLDLDEVRNDPSLKEIDKGVKEMISEYNAAGLKNISNEKFIKENFAGSSLEKKIVNEIAQIKLETRKNGINEISEEWVKEWHEKRQKNSGKDPKTEDVRDFITSSLKNEVSEPEIILNHKEDNKTDRSILFRFISLSAAAAVGIFVLLRLLLPASDPEKLYISFYKPFNVISSVTRAAASSKQDGYSEAVESYKSGDYQTAATGFSFAIRKDTSEAGPRFFMGLTQLALGNYDQAIGLLTGLEGRSGEYRKDAEWYLGLTYLKTGEKQKAAKCFELLAQSPGFYQERSEKLLHRLK